MRDKIISMFKVISQAAIIFSFMILFLVVIGSIYGDSAKEPSTMFQLGNEGIASSTVWEIFVFSLIVSCLKIFLFSEEHLGTMMILWRSVILILLTFIIIICFIIIFGWFSMDNGSAWIGFILSFGVCTVGSTILLVIKTKLAGERYDRLLTDYKKRRGMEQEEDKL